MHIVTVMWKDKRESAGGGGLRGPQSLPSDVPVVTQGPLICCDVSGPQDPRL